MIPRRGAVIAAGVAAITLAAGCGSSNRSTHESGPSSSDGPGPVVVSTRGCAPGWIAPRSGRHQLAVTNQTGTVYSVDLLGSDQTTVYGQVELLAPHTTASMDVIIPPGRYSLECESISGPSTFSAVVTVTGPPATGAHPYVPADFSQIQLATLHYRSELAPRMAQLASDTDALQAAIAAGDLPRARQLWLPAHLDYERLGAAYDTFGDFGDEIEGRPGGLPGGVADPHFEGFLRLEYGLWHGQPAAELRPIGARLDTAVHQLVVAFPQMQTPANDVSRRTHEILENTLQFVLTGDVDEGSHTSLATAAANVAGTQLALGAIAPLLRAHDPTVLAGATGGLAHLATLLAGYDHGGVWTPLDSLDRSARETLDATVSSLLEQLSPIPDLLELPVKPDTADS